MNIRVLVVEGEAVQRRMLLRLLDLCPGLEGCGGAGDGEEALALALDLAPDVILLDPILPGRSGLSFLREYRARGGAARTLALVSLSGPVHREACLRAGADFVLDKPVPIGELVEHIRLLWGGSSRRVERRLEEMDDGVTWLKGRDYVILAAQQLIRSPSDAMKAVYLQVAEREKTGYLCVEKNIRSYIARLHRLDRPAYRELLGPVWQDRPPSNGVFLRLLAAGVKIP